jgi:DNA invertase Pin-like site-specific DNA recombinase
MHLIKSVRGLMQHKIGSRVLTGQGANIDMTTASGRLVFGTFPPRSGSFERELISGRMTAGLVSALAFGRSGGRPPK